MKLHHFFLLVFAIFILPRCDDMYQVHGAKTISNDAVFASMKEDQEKRYKKAHPAPTVAEQKKNLSEKKLQEIRELRDKLTSKIAALQKTAGQFDLAITTNANEVRDETTRQPAETFDQAIKNKRIKASLEAIQKAQAYKDIVIRESRLATDAVTEAEGIEKQLNLDIIILASVDEPELDDLLVKLNLVFNKIQPKAKELVLMDEKTRLKPLEEIYKTVISPPPVSKTIPAQKPAAPKQPTQFIPREISTTTRNAAPVSINLPAPVLARSAPVPFITQPPVKKTYDTVNDPKTTAKTKNLFGSPTKKKAALGRHPDDDIQAPPPRTQKTKNRLAPDPPEQPTPPETQDQNDHPAIVDALEQCRNALDDDNCERAQTLCTNDLVNKFPWVELRLKNCWKLAALDKCRDAIDDDNCERAQTLCADITLKDYEWIDTAIKACWEFKKF